MSVKKVASRYAKSLIDLAVERGSLETIHGDIESFSKALENRDLYLMLKNPIISTDKKRKVLKALFEGNFDKMTMTFFDIVLTKGRESYLIDVAKEFIAQYKVIKHVSTVKLTTAAPLSEATLNAIRQKLLGSEETDTNVEIETVVDPDLIGGFVLEFDGKLYDSSVAHKLDELKKEFKDNLYISQIMAK